MYRTDQMLDTGNVFCYTGLVAVGVTPHKNGCNGYAQYINRFCGDCPNRAVNPVEPEHTGGSRQNSGFSVI